MILTTSQILERVKNKKLLNSSKKDENKRCSASFELTRYIFCIQLRDIN